MPVLQKKLTIRRNSETFEIIFYIEIPGICCYRHPQAAHAEKAGNMVQSRDDRTLVKADRGSPGNREYRRKRS